MLDLDSALASDLDFDLALILVWLDFALLLIWIRFDLDLVRFWLVYTEFLSPPWWVVIGENTSPC